MRNKRPLSVEQLSLTDFNLVFRGFYQEVKVRLEQYLPDVIHLAETGLHTLDLGCGRGEWLEILTENKIQAFGLDTNPELISVLRGKGFATKNESAHSHLKSLEDCSVALVTAFHLLEHLTTPELCELLFQIKRVLQPGGIFIAETPNALNIGVASSTFWIDPTHTRPLHPEVLRYWLQHFGFSDVEIRFLNPLSDHFEKTTNLHLNLLLDAYFGPQDCGVKACVA